MSAVSDRTKRTIRGKWFPELLLVAASFSRMKCVYQGRLARIHELSWPARLGCTTDTREWPWACERALEDGKACAGDKTLTRAAG